MASSTDTRPNIVFLFADDMRWDAMSCADNPVIQTPNLDRIATEGRRFTNAFATTAICAVSRASVMTGQYAHTHGVRDFAKTLSEDQFARSYPEILRSAGYFTGFVGKWGIGNEMPETHFDFFNGFPGQGQYFHEIDGKQRHLTSMIGEDMVDFLKEPPGDKPFCLSVSFKASHVQDQDPKQFLPDPRYDGLYVDKDIPKAPSMTEYDFERQPDFIRNSEGRTRWEKRFLTEEKRQESTRNYYRLINGIDEAVGKFLDALDAQGLAENTIVIFTADQGMFMGEHGLAGKWLMHEESIRIPLLIRGPGVSPGVIDAMALTLDFAPTMLDCAGVIPPPEMEGKSLRPFFASDQQPWRDDFFYEHHYAHGGKIPRSEGVRTNRWKYIKYLDSDPLYEELYDLDSDPFEMHNRAKNSTFARELEEMRERYAKWRGTFG